MKHLLTLTALTVALAAPARSLTPDESLARLAALQQQAPHRAPALGSGPAALTLAHTATAPDGAATCYIFDRPAAGGYIILAADATAPAILGYTDAGSFDTATAAPALIAWIADCSRTIAAAAKAGVDLDATQRHLAPRQPIPPILTTKWGQSERYGGIDAFNGLCPVVEGRRTPAGCVATAIAQVLYHYRYPERTTGRVDYSTYTHHVGIHEDLDGHPIDWDAMQTHYGTAYNDAGRIVRTEYTQAAADAVNYLMYAIGTAAQMDYCPSASGASSAPAAMGLVEHFGCNPYMSIAYRMFYDDSQWQQLVYGQLAAGHPVVYSGFDTNGGGHAFVCDGYDAGLYHINWGWNGMSDGYYTILGTDALHPLAQGIGGSYTSDAFSEGHEIMFGLQPAQPDGTVPPTTIITSRWQYLVDGKSDNFNLRSGQSIKVSLQNGCYTQCVSDLYLRCGLRFTNVLTGQSYIMPDNALGWKYTNFRVEDYWVNTADIPDAVYDVTPVYLVQGADQWTDIHLAPSVHPVRVAYGDASLSDITPDASLFCSAVDIPDYDDTRTLHIRIEQPGNYGSSVFTGSVAPAIYDADGEYITLCELKEFQAASMKYIDAPLVFDYRIPAYIPDGPYTIIPMAYRPGSEHWTPFALSDMQQMTVTDQLATRDFWLLGDMVSTTEIILPDPDADLFCATLTSPVKTTGARTLRATLTNPGNAAGTDFDGNVALALYAPDAAAPAASLPAASLPATAAPASPAAPLYVLDAVQKPLLLSAHKYQRQTLSFSVPIPAAVPDGHYTVVPVAFQKNSTAWTPLRHIDMSTMKIDDTHPAFDIWLTADQVSTADPLAGIAVPTLDAASAPIYDLSGRRIAPAAHGAPHIEISPAAKRLR